MAHAPREKLRAENAELRLRLEEAEQALDAIRTGEVESLVVDGPNGLRIFSLEGAAQSYRVLVESMNEGAATVRENGIIVYCNARFAALTGLPLQKVMGSAFVEYVCERCRREFEALLRGASDTSARTELFLRAADGEEIPVYISVSATIDAGTPVVCVVATDLREQKRSEAIAAAERVARESEERLRQTLRYASAGTWEWHIASGELVWSPETYDLYGIERGARPVTRVQWERAVHPDDVAPANDAAAACIQGRASEFRTEFRVRTAHRGERWLLGVGRRECASDGSAVRLVGLDIDITERKRVEEELRRSQEVLEAFFASSPGILNIEDDELRYVKTDPLTPTYFGLDRQTIVGRSAASLAPPLVEKYGAMMKRVLETGAPALNQEVEIPVPTRPGEIACWRASYFPVPLPGGNRGLGVMGVEITDMKRAEAALRASQAQLQELAARMESVREEEKARIARDLHDELGQLLTAVRIDLDAVEEGLSQLLAREEVALVRVLPGGTVDAAVAALLDRSVAASEVLAKAIESMHRVAIALRPATLDQLGLLEALRNECSRFEARTSVRFEFASGETMSSFGPEVDTALFRIAQEALTNVVRHAQAHRARITLEMAGHALMLRVEDDGVGFDAARVRPGALGIIGMRERAHRLGGVLKIAPGAHGGTVLDVRIPVHPERTRASARGA